MLYNYIIIGGDNLVFVCFLLIGFPQRGAISRLSGVQKTNLTSLKFFNIYKKETIKMKFFNKAKTAVATGLMALMPVVASAGVFNGARDGLVTQMDPFFALITTALWIAAAAFLIFGAFQFASAFRQDDAEGKSKGMRNLIAGAIMLALAVLAPVVWGQII